MHQSRERIERLGFQMWQDGLLDIEIAKELGCHRETVLNWRQRNGLEQNYFGKVLPKLDEFARSMHEDGMTDGEIAERIGCKACTVCAWRKRNGLVANGCPGSVSWRASIKKAIAGREDVMALHVVGFTDKEGAERLGVSLTAYRNRRYRLGLKPNKKGQVNTTIHQEE